ncbi:hypothetical protein C1H46_000162 [Malus baccata]|uniref:Uncharacterized protein n=1 Tax=Malus baccata TaxID=106549 RepID=A0A540NUH3_MALBA|nr:hypothetical protein C1H46_000162 [Malus baccata]
MYQSLRPSMCGTNSSPPSLQSRESFGWRLQIQSMYGPKWLDVLNQYSTQGNAQHKAILG